MKKTLLPLLISSLLAGCNFTFSSSSDLSLDNRFPPASDKFFAYFADIAPLEGVNYSCDTGDAGLTNEKGELLVSEGASCEFDLDGYALGKTKTAITKHNNQITSYSLEQPTSAARDISGNAVSFTQFISNLSALFQTLGSNDGGVTLDLRFVVGTSLIISAPLNATSDKNFEASVLKVEITQADGTVKTAEQLGIKPVTPSAAKDALDEKLTSQNVSSIFTRLFEITHSDSLTELDLEAELAQIRTLLEQNDGSNGTHQKALLAVLEIAEVINMHEVADRISFTGGSNYAQMLAQALEQLITPDVLLEINAESFKGSTEDEAKVLVEAAKRLEKASEDLGAALPGDGAIATYKIEPSQEVLSLNYQDALIIRSASMITANLLYTLASYDFADDSYYLPKEETLEAVDVVIESAAAPDWQYTWEEAKKDFDIEFIDAAFAPVSVIKDQSTLKFRKEAKTWLISAKESLTKAIVLAKDIDIEHSFKEMLSLQEIQDTKDFIAKLDRHLSDPTSSYAYQEQEKTYYANLHNFYDMAKGLDRSDFDIIAEYRCDTKNLSAQANSEYSSDLSKILAAPTCSHSDSYLIKDDWGQWLDWNKIKPITRTSDENAHQFIFVPAIDAKLDIFYSESNTSNITDVVWCGIDEQNQKISCLENQAQ